MPPGLELEWSGCGRRGQLGHLSLGDWGHLGLGHILN